MKKIVEAVLVAAVTVVTVSTAATIIHNRSLQIRSTAAKIMNQNLQQVFQSPGQTSAGVLKAGRSVANHGTAPAAASSQNSTVHGVHTTAAPISSGAPSDSSIVKNWSAADTKRFLEITDKLVHSLTPADWNNIEQALTQGSERQAQIVLMTTAHKYLTPSDEAWVATHLAGNKPFGPVDVSLLQQAFKQLEGQLTPAEQQLLQENHLL
ncbi:hypothetical protein [Alicyclobacillus sp. SO9]|uniref:hypothetical protein n=1 Tax=Alicyclobacillus sp. SO9 TaxID=2665646 RepID=UPI0018E84341|nr:hypothetical protein [Alicyclobacillus sp. SO9]QQE77037.1 hypothetical protein GI364_13720 [Alicyclobacillus sp. SO9]